MKRNLLPHILPTLAAMLALMLSLSGCTSGSGDEPSALPNAVTVTFSVVAPRPNPTAYNSRAVTWGDPYQPDAGSDFDNILLRDQLRAVITNQNCTQEIAVTRLFCSGAKESEEAVSYEFVGMVASADIENLKKLTNGKLHIIANAGTAPQLVDKADFTLSENQPGADFEAIPMWGVKTIDFSKLERNERFNVGSIELLRAVAKVEVTIDSEGDAANSNLISALNSLSINRLNAKGYLLPVDWASAKETKVVAKDSNSLRVNDSPAEGEKTFSPAADKKSITFYLPECQNTEDDELYLTLNYDSQPDPGKTDFIYFCNYRTDGKPLRGDRYHIRRNHLYRFAVKRKGTEIQVSADVMPYKSVELEPEFGLTPKPKDKTQTTE